MLKYYVIEFYHKSKEYITDYYIQNQYWHIALMNNSQIMYVLYACEQNSFL